MSQLEGLSREQLNKLDKETLINLLLNALERISDRLARMVGRNTVSWVIVLLPARWGGMRARQAVTFSFFMAQIVAACVAPTEVVMLPFS